MALTGCLQKASTKMESLISSFNLQAPREDPANPPNFENVDQRGYVRFKGTCLSIVDSFQIQFVTDADENGVPEYRSWENIPTTAPADTRASAIQTTYPLNAAEYDTNCSGDGAYDFWVLVSQVDTWLGAADVPMDYIHIRGMFGLFPTDLLVYDTDGGSGAQEANSFEFYAGYTPMGTGLCAEMNVYLVYESAGEKKHNVTNSGTKSFTATFDTGFSASDITIYNSTNCAAGTELSPFSFTISANTTFKKFSYKMNTVVSPMKNMTLTTSSFGSPIDKSVGFQSNTASAAVELRAYNKLFVDDGRCASVHLLATDINGTTTNSLDYATVNVTVTLSDTTNFEFYSDCNSGTALVGNARTVTFANGGEHKQVVFVRAKSGVSSTTTATLTISQDLSEFSTVPTIYINPPQPVHHLQISRVDQLSFLFNHECYPFEVTLHDEVGSVVNTSMAIDFRFQVSAGVTIHADAGCSDLDQSTELQSIPTGASGASYWWTRSPYSPSSGNNPISIMFDYNSMSIYVADPSSNITMNSTVSPTLSEILGRNKGEMPYWFFENMDSSADFDFTSTENSLAAHSSGSLVANTPMLTSKYIGNESQSISTSRFINRRVYDFTVNVATDAPSASVNNSMFLDWSLNTSGASAIIGAYINMKDLTADSGQQIFVNAIHNSNSSFYMITIQPDGNLRFENAADNAVLCSTGPGAIAVNNWTLAMVKISNQSGVFKCQLYIDGSPTGTQGTLPYNLATSFGPTFGFSGNNMRFEGQMAEIFLDLDPTSSGASRYSDAALNDIYSKYFSQRYLSSP